MNALYFKSIKRPHPDDKYGEAKWLTYAAKIVTKSGLTIPGKTNLKKAWYGLDGKEYEAGPADDVYAVLAEAEGGHVEYSMDEEDKCEHPVGKDGWFHCVVNPGGGAVTDFGKFKKGEGKCYYTSNGEELESTNFTPIDVYFHPELHHYGIKLEWNDDQLYGIPLYDCTEENLEEFEKITRPHPDHKDDYNKWKIYYCKIETKEMGAFSGKTNLKKAWYTCGKEMEANPAEDKVYLLKSEFVEQVDSIDQCENSVCPYNTNYHCYAAPGNEEGERHCGPVPGRLTKYEGKETCTFGCEGKEWESSVFIPMNVKEEAYVSLEELGIKLEEKEE